MSAPPPPPDWPTPNYIDPPTRAPMVVATNIALIIVALFFVILRVFTRFRLGSQGIDDHLIVVSWAFSFAMSLCIVLSTKYGLGRHLWDIPPEWSVSSGKLAYAFTILYTPTLVSTKCSILAFYLNKLGTEKKFRIACWIAMGYTISSGVGAIFANLFQCSPIAGAWDHTVPNLKCVNIGALYYFSGVNNLFTDLLLLLLPIPVIWKLKLPMRQKLGLVMIFSMGLFVTIISIIRIKLVADAMSTNDLSWTGALSATWSGVELNVAIICACMPAVKQFLSWIVPGFMGSTIKSKTGYYENGGGSGLKYHDGTTTRKSIHALKSSRSAHGPNTTVITATHHDGDSEEYIMNDLDGRSGGAGSGNGINKMVEVIVESEVVKDEASNGTADTRRSW